MTRRLKRSICLFVLATALIQYASRESFVWCDSVFSDGRDGNEQAQDKDANKRTQDALGRYLSGDPQERQRAKEDLSQLGKDALPTLLSFVALQPFHLGASKQWYDIQELLRFVPPEIAAPYSIEILENKWVDDLFEMPIPAQRALI